MRSRSVTSLILWYEIFGFSLIIVLSWVDELINLPSHIFGGDHKPDLREGALESLIVLLVALPVILLTHRLVSHLYYLEGFLRVCAWCKKIEKDEAWIPVDEFFEQSFATETTHGICPACLMEIKHRKSKS